MVEQESYNIKNRKEKLHHPSTLLYPHIAGAQ
jgi:hypothetical protein